MLSRTASCKEGPACWGQVGYYDDEDDDDDDDDHDDDHDHDHDVMSSREKN